MASFRKIGGIRKKPTVKVQPQENQTQNKLHETHRELHRELHHETHHELHHELHQEMHISQVQSEQTVYYPLMSNNETSRFFEDSAITYCFNHTMQDFALNLDNLSVTNIFNVDSLTFADGSSMTSGSHQTQSYHKVYSMVTSNDTSVIQFVNGLDHIRFPDVGVYLVTFYIGNVKLADGNQALQVTFNKDLATQTSMTFPIFNRTCTGTWTTDYRVETFAPHLHFELINAVIADATNCHVSVTRIA